MPSSIRTQTKSSILFAPILRQSTNTFNKQSRHISTACNLPFCFYIYIRSLHHSGDGTTPDGAVVDPTAAVGGGLAAYSHASQDYGRNAREVYHAQSLGEAQGRPGSNQTMYNPSATGSSQYETASAQSVDGSSNSALGRLPSTGSAKQSPSPTASAGSAAWSTAAPGYANYEGISPSRSPGN